MESRVNVIVNITDANDLAPSFSILPAPLTLAENMTVVTTVASVRATDEDSGTNGEVVYQLANDEGNFAIDAVGDITLVASLDREVTAVYNLTIMALDHGQPQMTATEYLIVTVGDINDETPEFSQVCCCVFIVRLTLEISWLMVMTVNVRTVQLCGRPLENRYSKRPRVAS